MAAQHPNWRRSPDRRHANYRELATAQPYGEWLSHSDVPKLFIKGEPGALIRGRTLDFVRTWPNQTEVTVPGVHFIQENSPDEIGAAVASFVRAVRSTS